MAGQDDSAAAATTATTEPKAEGSSQAQEKPQAQSEAGRQQPEDGASGGNGTRQQQQQETEKEPPSPPLPPRPLPPPHQGSGKSLPPMPMPMPQQGVHFGPLPIEIENDEPEAPYERPVSLGWQKASMIGGVMSLVTSAIILGVGIALGYLNAPYYSYYGLFSTQDLQFSISASAAGLAILIVALDFVTACLSSRGLGMHPGALVAFHLIIWLLAMVAVIFVALFLGYDGYDDYEYPDESHISLESRNMVYQQVLLAFDAILLAIHFILFIGSCVETNKVNHAKRKIVIVRVPVPAGGPYPGAQYPVYGSPQTLAPQGQPLPNQPAAVYGGYYAPETQAMGWQPVNSPQWQGYYATAAGGNPARHSWQQPAAPALASSSGSRRSQRLSQPQAQTQAQQHQATPAEAAPERTA